MSEPGDGLSVELGDAASGICALLGSPLGLEPAALVFEGGEPLVAAPVPEAEVEIAPDGSRVEAGLGEMTIEVELAVEDAAPVALALLGGSVELSTCQARVELQRPAGRRRLSCPALLGRATGIGGPEGPSVGRSLAVLRADGRLLGLRSARGEADAGHGEEEIAAAWREPEAAPQPVAEPLLSTQYDDAGRATRATLELWLGEEDEVALRGGGKALASAALELDGGRLEVASMAWKLDGEPAAGVYAIRRG